MLRRFTQIAKDDEGMPRYRNIDELRFKISPYYTRTTRAEISDAPPKIYQRRAYELSEEQRKFYNAIRETYQAELHNGREIRARLVLQRYMLLQQVLSNRIPQKEEAVLHTRCEGNGCEECDHLGVILQTISPTLVDPENDPRLQALMMDMDPDVPTLIWCRFRFEVELLSLVLSDEGYQVVRYDGALTAEEREMSLSSFQRGTSNVMIGTTATGGRGLRIDKAELMIFYSNTFELRQRLQAEDRAEAIDRKISTGIIDICAVDTIDEIIINTLRNKKELSDLITGDTKRQWL